MSTENPPSGQPQQGRQSESARGRGIGTFTVEFADDYCRNFTVNTPPLHGVDIRGRWDTSRMARRPQRMRDMGTMANRIPSPMPGAMLEVDARRKRIKLFDPLGTTEEGKKLLAEYNAVAKDVPSLKKDCKAFDTVEHDLDDDQLKTLLFELLRKRESKCLDVVSGELPTAEQIDSLPGHELYDPGNLGEDKPRYKKDLEAWKNQRRVAGAL